MGFFNLNVQQNQALTDQETVYKRIGFIGIHYKVLILLLVSLAFCIKRTLFHDLRQQHGAVKHYDALDIHGFNRQS